MEHTGMLGNARSLAAAVRQAGVRVFHAPISFAADGSDNPNRRLGILSGCDSAGLFTRGTWNAQICEAMQPVDGDVVVVGKRGLSAFPDTDLEAQLKAHGIETIALGGFMANCCVESTMREACEKGFNVITLTDCVATTTLRGYQAAVEITYPFFSTPMKAASFERNIRAAAALALAASSMSRPMKRPRVAARVAHPRASWAVRDVGVGLWTVGPWFADVRQSAIGEKIVLRSGWHELDRYLTFAQAVGTIGDGPEAACKTCDAIYSRKLPNEAEGETAEPFGWFCNMTVAALPDGGCLVYSPVLTADNTIAPVVAELRKRGLLPVRLILAPTPQHHLCLADWQQAFPDALLLCGRASAQMQPLTRKRRDLRCDGVLSSTEITSSVRVRPSDSTSSDAKPQWQAATVVTVMTAA